MNVLPAIARPYRWWIRHPWITWWATLLVLVADVTFLSPTSPHWMAEAWGWLMAALVLFAAMTFLVGLCVSFRKSTWRGLLIAAAAVVLVVAITVPLYMNVGSRARVAKAHADVRALAAAIALYKSHMGRLPAALDDLTRPATNPRGETNNAIIGQVPSEPAGYEPYRYEPRPDGTFTISGAGDGVTGKAP